MLKIFDTHAHYSDAVYNNDREDLFRRMYVSGVECVTLIGASLEESKMEKEIFDVYSKMTGVPRFYYTIGDHPDEIPKFLPDTEEGIQHLMELENLCKNADGMVDTIAIGEIGLDYHGDFKNEEDYKLQKEWLVAEIELAKKLKLPLVIHSRDACKDTFDIIKEKASSINGVIHCFSYEKEIAMEYVKLGYYIGIGGTVTFKNARKVKEVVEIVPIESIVTETDAPWLAPTPHRGKRNESTYIKYVIEEIARCKHLNVNDVSEILFNNALELYNLQ